MTAANYRRMVHRGDLTVAKDPARQEQLCPDSGGLPPDRCRDQVGLIFPDSDGT